MHWVFSYLRARALLTRYLGVKRWVCTGSEVVDIMAQVRQELYLTMSGK